MIQNLVMRNLKFNPKIFNNYGSNNSNNNKKFNLKIYHNKFQKNQIKLIDNYFFN